MRFVLGSGTEWEWAAGSKSSSRSLDSESRGVIRKKGTLKPPSWCSSCRDRAALQVLILSYIIQ